MRFVSYNIHRAVGVSGKQSIDAIRTVLDEVSPDVVGLNEALRGPMASDQPARLGRALGMAYRFGRTTTSRGIPFGNAALVRGRVLGRRDVRLSSAQGTRAAGSSDRNPRPEEPRSMLLLDVEVEGLRFAFGVTHLDPRPELRAAQLEALTRALTPLAEEAPFVLVGDFNAAPEQLRSLCDRARLALAPGHPTFPAASPTSAIDHVLFSRHWHLVDAFTVGGPASDHAALVADLASVY